MLRALYSELVEFSAVCMLVDLSDVCMLVNISAVCMLVNISAVCMLVDFSAVCMLEEGREKMRGWKTGEKKTGGGGLLYASYRRQT